MNKHSIPLRFGARPNRARAEALRQIKREVVRIGQNGTREEFKFAEPGFKALSELREA